MTRHGYVDSVESDYTIEVAVEGDTVVINHHHIPVGENGWGQNGWGHLRFTLAEAEALAATLIAAIQVARKGKA